MQWSQDFSAAAQSLYACSVSILDIFQASVQQRCLCLLRDLSLAVASCVATCTRIEAVASCVATCTRIEAVASCVATCTCRQR